MTKKILKTDKDFAPPIRMIDKLDDYGVKKTEKNILSLFLLGILAGAFIAIGAIFYVGTTTGILPHVGYGIKQLLGGLAFSLGLILVMISGAELFTGNTLLINGFLSKKIPLNGLLTNWVIVYTSNFVGSLLTAFILLLANQHLAGDTSSESYVGITIMKVAAAKCSNGFITAMFKGIMCNTLVCLAVWMCLAAKSVTDKILIIIFPITAFVAMGFEHSVANMFIIPLGLAIKFLSLNSTDLPTIFSQTALKLKTLSIESFFTANLLPVTIGNIIGGAGFVGIIYWIIYKRESEIK